MLYRCLAFPLACLLAASTPAHADGGSPGVHRFANEPGPVEQWYRVAGQESGVPVIFLHGGPGEGSMVFQHAGGPEIEAFAKVVYYDQRGAGRSARPANPDLYSIPILVADVERLRRELGAERVVLLGHSFGSALALEYAAQFPEHTAGLVLTGAIPDLPAAIRQLCDSLRTKDAAAYARALEAGDGRERCDPFAAYEGTAGRAYVDANMFPDDSVRRKVEAWDNEEGLGNSGEMGGALWRKGLMEYRFTRPERLTMPVLFIDGAEDHQTALVPQQRLAARVRDGRVQSFAGAGHFPFVDQPDRFARSVREFLLRIGA